MYYLDDGLSQQMEYIDLIDEIKDTFEDEMDTDLCNAVLNYFHDQMNDEEFVYYLKKYLGFYLNDTNELTFNESRDEIFIRAENLFNTAFMFFDFLNCSYLSIEERQKESLNVIYAIAGFLNRIPQEKYTIAFDEAASTLIRKALPFISTIEDKEGLSVFDLWGQHAISQSGTAEQSDNAAMEAAPATLGEQEVNIANPYKECDSLKMASRIAGFKFDIPDELMDEYDVHISAIEDTLIQVIFYSGGEEVFRLRKGYIADISGDYNKYEIETEFDSDSVTGTFFGHDEGTVNTAVWTSGDFTYSLTTAGDPLESGRVREIIETVTGD